MPVDADANAGIRLQHVDGAADVAERATGLHGLDALPHALLGDLHQVLAHGVDVADEVSELAVSPKGKEIAFVSNRSGNPHIYRLFLNENVVLQLGGNLLIPQDGGKQILGSGDSITTGNLGIVLVY